METSTNQGSAVLNKIIIPVITTVLGATAIYFLGFNKKGSGRTDMEQMLISKEATVKAWKSFVTIQNVDYKNEKSLVDEYMQKIGEIKKTARGYEDFVKPFRDFEKDLMRERNKTTKDVENILKDQDIDRDFISMLNRILDDSKNYDKSLSDFFDDIVAILKADGNEVEKGQNFQAEIAKYTSLEEKMNDRVINQAEDIAKTLSDRYSQAFDLNQLQAYVELKKEKDKKVAGGNITTDDKKPIELGGQAPADPNKGTEHSGSVPTDNNPTYTNANNQIEPTVALLAGQWEATGNTLELSRDGDMYWSFGVNGYTSGDWTLTNGQIKMNATNPDTKKTVVIVGGISDFSRSSLTLTIMATKEVYRFRKKADY